MFGVCVDIARGVDAHLLRFGHLVELCQLAARHFDDLNNARRDFDHAYVARVAGGEFDFDGFEAGRIDELTWRSGSIKNSALQCKELPFSLY